MGLFKLPTLTKAGAKELATANPTEVYCVIDDVEDPSSNTMGGTVSHANGLQRAEPGDKPTARMLNNDGTPSGMILVRRS